MIIENQKRLVESDIQFEAPTRERQSSKSDSLPTECVFQIAPPNQDLKENVERKQESAQTTNRDKNAQDSFLTSKDQSNEPHPREKQTSTVTDTSKRTPPAPPVWSISPGKQWGLALLLTALIAAPLSFGWNQFNCKRLISAGRSALHQCHSELAEKCFLSALAESEKFGQQNRNVADCLYHLAEIYRRREQFGKAETFQQRALQLRLHLLGETSPDVAASLVSLGRIRKDSGQFESARQCYEKALCISKCCGQPREIATVLVRLADLSDETNKDLACNLLEQSLQVQGESSTTQDSEQNVEAARRLAWLFERQSLPPRTLYKWLSILSSKPGNEQAILTLLEAIPSDGFSPKRKNEHFEQFAQALEKSASLEKRPVIFNTSNFFNDWRRSAASNDEGLLLKRQLTLLEDFKAVDTAEFMSVLSSLASCKQLSVDQRKMYADRAIQSCERLTRRHATRQVGQNRLRFNNECSSEFNNSIHRAYLTKIELEPSQAAQIRAQEIKMWERANGAQSPNLAIALIELTADLPLGAERDAYYQRAVPILARAVGSISTKRVSPESGHTLNQIYDSLDSVRQVDRSMSLRSFYTLIERIAGPDHYLTGKALTDLAYDTSLPKAERISLIQRALKIWRDSARHDPPLRSDGTYAPLVAILDVRNAFESWKEIAPGDKKEILKQEVSYLEHALGPTNFSLAESLLDLGKLSTVAEAERVKYLERAVSIWEHDPDFNATLGTADAFQTLAKIGGKKNHETIYRRQLEWIKTHDNARWLRAATTLNLANATTDRSLKVTYLQQAAWLALNTSHCCDGHPSILEGALSQIAELDENLAWEVATTNIGHPPELLTKEANQLTVMAKLKKIPTSMRRALALRAAVLWEQQPHIGVLGLGDAIDTFTILAQLQSSEADTQRQWRRAIDLCVKHSGASAQTATCLNRLCSSIQQRYRDSNTSLPESKAKLCRGYYERALRIWEQHDISTLSDGQIKEYIATLTDLATLLPPFEATSLYHKALVLADKVGNQHFCMQALVKMCVINANNNELDKARQTCALMEGSGNQAAAQNFRQVVRQLAGLSNVRNKKLDSKGYLSCLNTQINSNWASPCGDAARVRITFDIGTDGGVSKIKKIDSTGPETFAHAGMRCITNAAPFLRLPRGAKPLHIDYTFSQLQ